MNHAWDVVMALIEIGSGRSSVTEFTTIRVPEASFGDAPVVLGLSGRVQEGHGVPSGPIVTLALTPGAHDTAELVPVLRDHSEPPFLLSDPLVLVRRRTGSARWGRAVAETPSARASDFRLDRQHEGGHSFSEGCDRAVLLGAAIVGAFQ